MCQPKICFKIRQQAGNRDIFYRAGQRIGAVIKQHIKAATGKLRACCRAGLNRFAVRYNPEQSYVALLYADLCSPPASAGGQYQPAALVHFQRCIRPMPLLQPVIKMLFYMPTVFFSTMWDNVISAWLAFSAFCCGDGKRSISGQCWIKSAVYRPGRG